LAQALHRVLEAAVILEKHPNIKIVLVGDGAERERLQNSAGPNVLILDPLPKAEMPNLLAAADAMLVSLRDVPLFDAAVPSKTYEALAASKPILMSAAGEAANLIREADGGIVIPPETPEALAKAIEQLSANPELCKRLGENGRRFVAEYFDRDRLAQRFEKLLIEA
jgi:glycosyltransferase involved in cell wall biosynthesis